MSHSKERKEKICLNCGAVLYGRYCHICGQENIEPKQSAWHLVTHFFYDITHFDGKFFTTLKDLLIRPGFLSREYMNGRRFSYLDPIRMYVFTSAFFFIIFFSVFNVKDWKSGTDINISVKGMGNARRSALAKAKTKTDSLAVERVFDPVKNMPALDSSNRKRGGPVIVGLDETQYKSVAAYDSLQKGLPADSRDGWLKRMFMHKEIDINIRYKGKRNELIREWVNVFIHNFPKMLFISLPLFALLLQILYVRRRKQFYYVDHGIFAIHLYIYSFIGLLFIFAINYIISLSGWSWLWFLNAGIILYSLYYFYKAMRNFYKQGRIKTFLKYIILYFFSFVVILILFSLFFLFSMLEV